MSDDFAEIIAEYQAALYVQKSLLLEALQSFVLLVDHTTYVENTLYEIPMEHIERVIGKAETDDLIGNLEDRARTVPFHRLQLEWAIDDLQKELEEAQDREG